MLPRCERRISSPIESIGVPTESISVTRKFRIWRLRSVFDGGIVAGALRAAVPARVVVGSVAVLLAVGLVVLAVVGDQVFEREAVVAGDEVDALLGLSLLVPVEVGAAEQPGRHLRYRAAVALPEAADVVAEAAVPLLPGVSDEASHLVEPRGVPRLGDQLRAREHGIRLDVPQRGWPWHGLSRFVAREDGGEIEAEPVDVHLFHPVAQAVLDQPPHDRVIGVERVSRARVVRIAAPVRLEQVVGVVREPAQAERGSGVIALRSVVEDGVEDHLDARAVERLDHVAELVERPERIAPRAVRVVRCEQCDGGVAPVVGETLGSILRVELEHGQKLHGRDAEIAQVGDLLDEPCVGARLPRGDAGARVPREAAHVELVDHRLPPGALERRVPLPIVVARIGDHALHRRRGVVARSARGLAAVPVGHGDRQGVGVEQKLARVEAQAALGREGTVGSISVELARRDPGHEDVPVVVGAVDGRIQRHDPGRLRRLLPVEEQELHPVRALREHAEVDAPRLDRRAERCAPAAADGGAGHDAPPGAVPSARRSPGPEWA